MIKNPLALVTALVLAAGLVGSGRASACVIDDECTDNDVCTGIETCLAGACAPGTPLMCGDGTPCTADSCDAVTGCQNPAVRTTLKNQ